MFSIVDFSKANSSYSGTDCTTIVQLNNKLIVLANLETLSHSIHREKSPVRVLGRSHPKGYTAGGRTIAGSMVFVVFDRAPLWDVIKEINHVRNPSDRTTSPLPDQLPPLDLIMVFHNEYGHTSLVRLYGVEFVDEGQVYSINDLYSECTMSYLARDMDQMIDYDDIGEFKNLLFERQVRGQFIDNYFQSLLDYQSKLERGISDCDDIITNLDGINSSSSVSGVITNTGSYFTNRYSGSGVVSKKEVNNKIDEQYKIRDNLVKELNNLADTIRNYSNNIKGWNAQAGDTGIAGNDTYGHSSPSSVYQSKLFKPIRTETPKIPTMEQPEMTPTNFYKSDTGIV
jgi:hypothetical protein